MIRRQLEEERRQRDEQKHILKRECESMLQAKEKEKFQEKELSHRLKQEQRHLHDLNAQRELERERRYRQFFQDYDRHMQGRLKAHEEHVQSPESQKNQQLGDWVKRNEALAQKQAKEKELFLNEWRRNVLPAVLA